MGEENLQKDWKMREEIKEKHKNYILTYTFASSVSPIAILGLTYIKEVSETEIVSDIEKQAQKWFDFYPVPMISCAFNSVGNKIALPSKKWSFFTIFINKKNEKNSTWEETNSSDFPEHLLTENYQDSVYRNSPYKFNSRHRLEVDIRDKHRIFFRIISFFWLFFIVLIPVAWAVGGYFFKIIATFSTIYILLKKSFDTLKYFSIIPKSKAEKKKLEEELKNKHFIYHCKKNPEAFEKLRAENSDKDSCEEILKEYASLPIISVPRTNQDPTNKTFQPNPQ